METTNNIEVANGMMSNSQTFSDNPKTLVSEIARMKAEGKVGTPEFTEKMRKMELMLGVSEISPFGTNELEIFEANLREMSLSEMQKLANKVGLNPFHERQTLKNILIKEFKGYTRNSRRNIMPTAVNSFELDPSNPHHQKLSKIINDI